MLSSVGNWGSPEKGRIGQDNNAVYSGADSTLWRLFGLMGFPQICHKMTVGCNFDQVLYYTKYYTLDSILADKLLKKLVSLCNI